MSALESRFWAALRRLESWYGDSLKAQSLAGKMTSSKAGSVVLAHPPESDAILSEWKHLWSTARTDENREQVVRDMDAEYENRLRSPSLKYRFVHGTLEWKAAIGTCDLTAKETARLYGVGLSTVYKYRNEHGNKTA